VITKQRRIIHLKIMCFSFSRNIIHGSDSVESAEKEIALWFKNKEDLVDWHPAAYKYVYDD